MTKQLMGSRGAGIAALLLSAAVVAAGSAATPPDLKVHFFFEDGKLAPLERGVTYQASKLPIAFRVTPPTAKWGGTQWKANNFSPYEIQQRHLTCPQACKPPYFGWAIIGQAGAAATKGVPRGIVLVMAGFSHTPSVAATVHNLRTRGHGASYGPTTTVTVGGFRGIQFDGATTAALHRFVPFSPPSTGSQLFPDEIDLHGIAHGYRFIVLNVRGKTVIVFIGTEALTPTQFQTFLAEASKVVDSVAFPA